MTPPMTPPSLDVAREILADVATKARASGDPINEIAAAAIDVVLARLAEHSHEPTVGVPVIGESDGPPIGSAQVGGGRATITMAVDVPADPDGRRPVAVTVGCVSVAYGPAVAAWGPTTVTATATATGTSTPGCSEHACVRHPSCLAAAVRCGCPECQRAQAAATAHGTAIPPDALVADMLPCPFCGRTDLLGVEPLAERGFLAVKCRACGGIGPGGRTSPYDERGRIDRVAHREATANWNRRKQRGVLLGRGIEVRTREQAIALFGRGTALADTPLPFVMVEGMAIAIAEPSGAPAEPRKP